MSDQHLAKHLGYPEGELAAHYPGITVLNHEWWKPEALTSLGSSTQSGSANCPTAG